MKLKHNGGTKKEREAYAVKYFLILENNLRCPVKRLKSSRYYNKLAT
jgi:hypothetical protein